MAAANKIHGNAIGSVTPGYVHYDKQLEPDQSVELQGSVLKWYNLARPDAPIPPAIRLLARSFLERESSAGLLKNLGDLGFVILHRCGEEFYFLLVSTWRNENELWESVYAKDSGKQPDFKIFEFPGSHRGTFCVWELAAVLHEQQAWTRYLLSPRDNSARLIYLGDRYEGLA